MERIYPWIAGYQVLKGMTGSGLKKEKSSNEPFIILMSLILLAFVIALATNPLVFVIALLLLTSYFAYEFFIYNHRRDRYTKRWIKDEVYRKSFETKAEREYGEISEIWQQLGSKERQILETLAYFENKEVYKDIFVSITLAALNAPHLKDLEIFQELASDLKIRKER